MTKTSRLIILQKAKHLFALHGYEGFSMRTLAKECSVGLSSIYHFFNDKDQILDEIYSSTNKELGIARTHLKKVDSAAAMLKQRIEFQFAHIEDVVYVLKYYLHFRPKFLKLDSGYFPAKGYLHIEEVIRFGVETGEFAIDSNDIDKESKVVAHAINGFLLEYYPNPPKKSEMAAVIDTIYLFLMRSLTNKEVAVK